MGCFPRKWRVNFQVEDSGGCKVCEFGGGRWSQGEVSPSLHTRTPVDGVLWAQGTSAVGELSGGGGSVREARGPFSSVTENVRLRNKSLDPLTVCDMSTCSFYPLLSLCTGGGKPSEVRASPSAGLMPVTFSTGTRP